MQMRISSVGRCIHLFSGGAFQRALAAREVEAAPGDFWTEESALSFFRQHFYGADTIGRLRSALAHEVHDAHAGRRRHHRRRMAAALWCVADRLRSGARPIRGGGNGGRGAGAADQAHHQHLSAASRRGPVPAAADGAGPRGAGACPCRGNDAGAGA
jgi:hypothetical protein